MVIFDLDDTIYKEIDFLKSAYKEIAYYVRNMLNISESEIFQRMLSNYFLKQDVFQDIVYASNNLATKDELLSLYRSHFPDIILDHETLTCLEVLKKKEIRMGIITDGRSITQRHKIKALCLENWINNDDIIISEEFGSEKPSERNFRYFEKRYPKYDFLYVGDNIQKDFVTPNQLGWQTVCLLDDGRNVHKQNFNLSEKFRPKFQVNTLKELINYLALG